MDGSGHVNERGSMARLKGASLVEMLVAAVIFLAVFAVSMEMLARITVSEESAADVVAAELEMRRAFDRYKAAPAGMSDAQEYDWGTIAVRVESYADSRRLNVVDICACMKRGGRVLRYRRIVEYEE